MWAQAAIEFLTKTLNFACETACRLNEAWTSIALGTVYSHNLKQHQDAIVYYEQALEISRELGNRAIEEDVMFCLSYCYGCLKQRQLAIEYSKQALAIFREPNRPQVKGIALACLANAYWHQKQYVRGFCLVVQSLLILFPWQSVDSYIILKKMVEEITQLGKKVIQSHV